MPEAERKVSQLDADVAEIYKLLRSLDENVRDIGARVMRQQARLNQIESDLQGLAEVQGAHTATLASHTATLNGHTATLDSHTATLDSHTATLDSHTTTLESHTVTLADHGSKLDQIIALLTGGNDTAQ